MPKKKKTREFIRFNTIKEYINTTFKMRSSESAVKKFIKRFNSVIKAALKDTRRTAKEDKRNTIMYQDIIPVIEKHLGKKHLSWQETAEEIIRQNPVDLGKISKKINAYIEKSK